eukprot:gnl/Dysnectes_brevis/168_a195_12566.p2 GENE.gnl/Dysnectes_brevis/168_a195_12566~~gnl/Dysnectes_brevis/168_a195_12566.p2  ORF type:complete len:190 (+),score=49.50 gnl/Dysnectes_brevis/168_a195_12566:37-606(+)
MSEIKLYGKWTLDDVKVEDLSLRDYISIQNHGLVPHSAGRWAAKRFRKARCPIVERLTNSLMMHGRNSGKKLKAARIVEQCFEIIHLLTNENPIQVLVDGIQNSGPREDSTRIGRGGAIRRQAVDVSPLRRVNLSIYNMTQGARTHAFRKMRSISECLAEEIINAANASDKSVAVNSRIMVERVAVSNR